MAYSSDLRERAVSARRGGMKRGEVCAVFGIHRTTLGAGEKRLDTQGSVKAVSPSGRRPKIGVPEQEALRSQVQTHPDATLEEHAKRWEKEQGQSVGKSSIDRALRRLKVTVKKRV